MARKYRLVVLQVVQGHRTPVVIGRWEDAPITQMKVANVEAVPSGIIIAQDNEAEIYVPHTMLASCVIEIQTKDVPDA